MTRIAPTLLLILLVVVPDALAYTGAEKDAFLKADVNKDRRISHAEFKTLIDMLAASGAPKAQTVKRWGVYGMAFKKIDTNADGTITPAELEAQR